jgi:F0F1-type ATP synthase membrane subunit b/b'
MEQVRVKSREEYQQLIEAANQEKRQVLEASIEKCHELEILLEKQQDELVAQIFSHLFKVEVR